MAGPGRRAGPESRPGRSQAGQPARDQRPGPSRVQPRKRLVEAAAGGKGLGPRQEARGGRAPAHRPARPVDS